MPTPRKSDREIMDERFKNTFEPQTPAEKDLLAQLDAQMARIGPLEQVLAARDQEIRDLKGQLVKQSESQRQIDLEKARNATLTRLNEQLTTDLRIIRSVTVAVTAEVKAIRKLIDHG